MLSDKHDMPAYVLKYSTTNLPGKYLWDKRNATETEQQAGFKG